VVDQAPLGVSVGVTERRLWCGLGDCGTCFGRKVRAAGVLLAGVCFAGDAAAEHGATAGGVAAERLVRWLWSGDCVKMDSSRSNSWTAGFIACENAALSF
jgi:hypothetical protein